MATAVHTTPETTPWIEKQTLPARIVAFKMPLLLVGIGALLLALLLGFFVPAIGMQRFLYAYLVGFCYIASISIGALLFVLVQHITRGGWSVVVRRLAEIMAMAILPVGALFLPILLALLAGDKSLYIWNDQDYVRTHEMVAKKAAYLNAGFFTVRSVIFFAVFSLSAYWLLKTSLRQDKTRDPSLTNRLEGYSAPLTALVFLSTFGVAFDWLMSLAPTWYSTIFGLYYFAGGMVGFFAVTILLVWFLRQDGGLLSPVSEEHRHDLGKFLFGFVCFWAYMAFSQYMLYWYANIPEETEWFDLRQNHGWEWISLVLIIGHFFLPFLLLLRRQLKRNSGYLAVMAVYMLVLHYVDIYWLAFPQMNHEAGPSFGVVDFLALVGMCSMYLYLLIQVAGQKPLMAIGDPRLEESTHFHNI